MSIKRYVNVYDKELMQAILAASIALAGFIVVLMGQVKQSGLAPTEKRRRKTLFAFTFLLGIFAFIFAFFWFSFPEPEWRRAATILFVGQIAFFSALAADFWLTDEKPVGEGKPDTSSPLPNADGPTQGNTKQDTIGEKGKGGWLISRLLSRARELKRRNLKPQLVTNLLRCLIVAAFVIFVITVIYLICRAWNQPLSDTYTVWVKLKYTFYSMATSIALLVALKVNIRNDCHRVLLLVALQFFLIGMILELQGYS
jgi:hypothetical protein